ncbi:hypothetical protein BU25DRAFT_493176 [Macroventuria anomochaeta]|uniref:Uncharacterized protein n=1 Tax=Macroventuria anomochaeta TaxID=301207 RepID=A0ACB6RTH2_9PLEO|nr:uncharacterized protein BU25DRAFT_493176 [Macroventuria anomochaeta]KAF2625201.1 hypothetical protein BU25DRAFT_493176 [Macroventuria anomochaeta]
MRASHLLAGLASLLALTSAAPTPGGITVTTVTTDASLELGKVKLCNGLRQQGNCVTVNAHLQCIQLDAPARFNVQSIIQSKGNLCSYSQGNRCDNTAFTIDSGSNEQAADVSSKWPPVLTGVICLPYSKAGASTNKAAVKILPLPQEDAAAAHTIDTRAKSTTETTPHHLTSSVSPVGDTLLCAPDINPGPCFKISATSQCVSLHPTISRQVRTIYQNKGSYCEYFRTDDCCGRLGYSDSTRQNVRTSVPELIGGQMGSAMCRPSAFGEGGEVEGGDGFAPATFVADPEGI